MSVYFPPELFPLSAPSFPLCQWDLQPGMQPKIRFWYMDANLAHHDNTTWQGRLLVHQTDLRSLSCTRDGGVRRGYEWEVLAPRSYGGV